MLTMSTGNANSKPNPVFHVEISQPSCQLNNNTSQGFANDNLRGHQHITNTTFSMFRFKLPTKLFLNRHINRMTKFGPKLICTC